MSKPGALHKLKALIILQFFKMLPLILILKLLILWIVKYVQIIIMHAIVIILGNFKIIELFISETCNETNLATSCKTCPSYSFRFY